MKRIGIIGLLLLVLAGCTLPGLGGQAKDNDIVIAGGNTTERQILSEVVAQMVSHYMPEVKVNQVNNLGSSTLIFQTLQRNNTNVSAAMYTGTSLTGELGMDPLTDPAEALEAVVEGYYHKFDMIWFPSFGFGNTYAFMVTREFSEKHNVTKLSDLESIADTLRAGVDMSWIDRQGDGYQDFKRVYGFDFKQVLPMEIGLVYNAVQVNEMDVVVGYSTDGRIDAYDLVVLEDDLHLFPPYDASPVIRKELLETYPELEAVLLRLNGSIDATTMQSLNRQSDELRIEPREVARQFLEENQYFESKEVKPLIEQDLYKDLLKKGRGES